jgi:chondroitin 4-sulfotransferase 11
LPASGSDFSNTSQITQSEHDSLYPNRDNLLKHLKAKVGRAQNYLPDPVRARLLVGRRKGLWRERGIIFIHVPKAAGTSVNTEIYGRFMGHMTAREARSYASEEFAALPSFSIVRNPWSRLVSAYRFATAGTGRGENDAVVAKMMHAKRYRGVEFRTFESFVHEWLVAKDLGRIDYVFRPQSLFTHDGVGTGPCMVDFLGRIEFLQQTEAYVSSVLGRPVSFGHHNRTADSDDYRNWYTPELIRIVGELYAADVKNFGYDF